MYSEKSLLGELLYDPAAKEVLMRHLPELFEQPYLLANMKIRTLQELLHFEKYDEAKADALVKELASVVPQIRDDHAPYIAGWLKALKDDKRAIFTAASHAQRAADFLTGLQPSTPMMEAAE